MNLEQVKEHFKYAKEVRCLSDGNIYNISKKYSFDVYESGGDFWANHNNLRYYKLYSASTNQLAEILTYIFDRGEEVIVLSTAGIRKQGKFLTFTSKGLPVVELECGNVDVFLDIRKLTPESLLEPQLSELKKKAKEMNCTVTVIFENK